ncbi:MAG: hypothetical protein CL878_11255 [Dehalococcoidia bacterium]|nr:hypothetical protein [Dehalococcoidia bacterium]
MKVSAAWAPPATGTPTGQETVRPEPRSGHDLAGLVQQVLGPGKSNCRRISKAVSGKDQAPSPVYRCTVPDENWRTLPALYRQLRGEGYRFDATRVPGGGQELRIWPQSRG